MDIPRLKKKETPEDEGWRVVEVGVRFRPALERWWETERREVLFFQTRNRIG
jgi:hypothetical protein